MGSLLDGAWSVARRAAAPTGMGHLGRERAAGGGATGVSPATGAHPGLRGRAGVVKSPRARGGCLGVIRWRAWKAAIGPGELPNELRSRDARRRPGELKHLSTRRKRNQPRFPQ